MSSNGLTQVDMELSKMEMSRTSGPQLSLSWENVNVYTKAPGFSLTQLCKKVPFQPKHIVQNVSGVARPGELLGKWPGLISALCSVAQWFNEVVCFLF